MGNKTGSNKLESIDFSSLIHHKFAYFIIISTMKWYILNLEEFQSFVGTFGRENSK